MGLIQFIGFGVAMESKLTCSPCRTRELKASAKRSAEAGLHDVSLRDLYCHCGWLFSYVGLAGGFDFSACLAHELFAIAPVLKGVNILEGHTLATGA